MSACNPFDLLNASGCFANLTGQQLMVVEASLLCSILQAANPMASCDPQAILEANPCLSTLTAYQLQVVSVELLCEILAAGGGGNVNACLLTGAGKPAAPCTFSFGLSYDPATAEFWFWSLGDNDWYKFIG